MRTVTLTIAIFALALNLWVLIGRRRRQMADDTLRTTMIKQAASLSAEIAIDIDRMLETGAPTNRVMQVIKRNMPKEVTDETVHLISDVVVQKRAEEMRLQRPQSGA